VTGEIDARLGMIAAVRASVAGRVRRRGIGAGRVPAVGQVDRAAKAADLAAGLGVTIGAKIRAVLESRALHLLRVRRTSAWNFSLSRMRAPASRGRSN
jgi:hypothetical protein